MMAMMNEMRQPILSSRLSLPGEGDVMPMDLEAALEDEARLTSGSSSFGGLAGSSENSAYFRLISWVESMVKIPASCYFRPPL